MNSVVVPPIIPANGSFNKPLAHCSLKQVKRLLMGIDLSVFKDGEGSFKEFDAYILEDLIPEASVRVARYCRTNFDYTRETWFFDGNSAESIILPRRFINYVNAVFLRWLPSQIWYRFMRPRLVDGSEFTAIGGVEPPLPPPESIPPEPTGLTYEQTVQNVLYTGTEDADLFVDPRRRMIVIPRRVLYAQVQSPQWQYDFFNGDLNVEVHFCYGFAPTAYCDGSPLQFDPITGELLLVSPRQDNCGGSSVDWSSGMPRAISQACARLVAADILRRQWRAKTGGLASMSVDGASESYGSSPYGGEADREEERAFQELRSFAILML